MYYATYNSCACELNKFAHQVFGAVLREVNPEDQVYGYNQVPVDLEDQEKMTSTCPFGTFAYRHMPFGLCNAPVTFQRCMVSIFSDMVEHFLEIFMDNFSV
jgi:hypothetical protein